METQRGNTTLELTRVTQADTDTYVCLIRIRWSYSLQHIRLRVQSWEQENLEVSMIPCWAKVDMWDGPPLRINCSFTIRQECGSRFAVTWWKFNEQGNWEKPDGRSNFWEEDGKGIGWLNYTQPRLGRDKGLYLCVIVCGIDGTYGRREAQGRNHLGKKIRPTHGVYWAVQGHQQF